MNARKLTNIINRELSIIYEDFSLRDDEKIKKARGRKNHE